MNSMTGDSKQIRADWNLLAVGILFVVPYCWLTISLIFIELQQATFLIEQGRVSLRIRYGATVDPNQQISDVSASAMESYKMGNEKLVRDDYAGSVQDYDRAIQTDPQFHLALVNRGIANIELSRFPEAIHDFDEAIKLNPKYFWSYYNRAKVKQQMKQHQEAIFDLDKAIDINPEFDQSYLLRSTSKMYIGDSAGSKQDYDTWSIISQKEQLRLEDNSLRDQSELTKQVPPFFSIDPLPFARVVFVCMLSTVGVLCFSKHTLKTRLRILALLLIVHLGGYLTFIFLALGFAGA
jgi:tetratricopeptide (TPR) repeat protein